MFLEGGLIFRRVDDDLAGEAVAEGVQGRTFLAFFGTGTSGKLRVGAIRDELGFGHLQNSFWVLESVALSLSH